MDAERTLKLNTLLAKALAPTLLALLLTPAMSFAGALHLPDGALGKPGLRLWGYRTDITLDASDPRGTDGAEFSSGRAEILIPVSRRVTILARYRAENRLNILHQSQIGLNLRLFQPDADQGPSRGINPDGPVGYPYFSLAGGFRLYESQTDVRFGVIDIAVIYPLSQTLTIGAGAEFNTDTSTTIVNRFFTSVSIYTAHYLHSEPYANPDGPVGYLNFRFSGGGSGEGVFGQLDILFPLNDRVTIGGFIRGERVAFPYERIATLGARFQLYPGVVR